MKSMTAILFLFMSAGTYGQIEELRRLFSLASVDEKANQQLLDKTKNAELKSNTLLYAYHGSALMTMANHYTWPTTKLDYFNRGKKKLEKAINYDLLNVEMRFIRYSVQKEAPAMLGYYEDIETDKAFIKKNIKKSGWTKAYQAEVLAFIDKE